MERQKRFNVFVKSFCLFDLISQEVKEVARELNLNFTWQFCEWKMELLGGFGVNSSICSIVNLGHNLCLD